MALWSNLPHYCLRISYPIYTITFFFLSGIFFLHFIQDNKSFINYTKDDYVKEFHSKFKSFQNIEKIINYMFLKPDQLVVFSSTSSLFGHAGETNSAMVYAAIDRICGARRQNGEKGLALRYGPIAEVMESWHEKYSVRYSY